MNSTSTPKSIEPLDGVGAREKLALAYEQIRRADEELTRLSEQVTKMQGDAARPPSGGRGRQSAPGRPALRALVGLPLVACIVVAVVAFRASNGGSGTKPVAAFSSPQLASTPSSPPENTPFPAQATPSVVQLAATAAAPPQATPVAQNPQQETAPTATALPDQTQLLQTMARDLANVERSIEQLKETQQQIASDNSKNIAELKASQEEIKRALARVSEQNLSKTSPPSTQVLSTLRKPERSVQPPRARARPLREWYYDE